MRSALGVERLRNIRQVFIQTGLSFRHLAMVLQKISITDMERACVHECNKVISMHMGDRRIIYRGGFVWDKRSCCCCWPIPHHSKHIEFLSPEPTSSFFLFPGEEKPLLAPVPHSSLRFMRLILLHNLLNLAGAHTLWILCQFGGWWQAPCIASDATQGASVVLLIKNESTACKPPSHHAPLRWVFKQKFCRMRYWLPWLPAPN